MPRERVNDLNVIASPFLSAAIELTDGQGRFRYDVALMETNRGCPYKCSFCYWGGAVGQRVRAFARERLRAELEIFARHKVHTVVLCDANFGMLRGDADFVDGTVFWDPALPELASFTALAKVVRGQHSPDGWYEVGALFTPEAPRRP